MSLHDIIRRAVQRGLAVTGEPSSLDGQPCGNVHIARSVEMFAGMYDQPNDNSTVRADVATIESQFNPRSGQVLVHPSAGTFKLTRRLRDNGHSPRFVVVQLP